MSRRAKSAHIWLSICTALAGGSSIAAGQSVPLSPVAQASGAQITTQYGIEFVTIGAPGNPAWAGNGTPGDNAIGRGTVDYSYRIGRTEVTTQQWVAFYNAWAHVSATQGNIPFVQIPGGGFWGATAGANPYGAGQGWTVPAGNAMRPVGNISWRTAAIFCNWLCNGQALTRDAFMNGAYDVSTFGYTGDFGDIFTDQRTHNPNAQFWIPTWDEWIKAAHYDPNRFGLGAGGYWNSSVTSDLLPSYGAPGQGQANSGWESANNAQFRTLLGAYPTTQSPWGLLDVAGGTMEWNETIVTSPVTGVMRRGLDGSYWGEFPFDLDFISGFGDEFPSFSPLDFGFRIAAAVPAPACSALIVFAGVALTSRRR